jgi:cyclic-di-GMP-binding protein
MAEPLQIPMRGAEVETRPMYVEEWLDSLPYIDFQNTIVVLYKALQASNKVAMKSGQRMELVTLYHRPYQYYLDTQIRSGAQHTLQTIETMQTQLSGMIQLAMELARASRLAVDETLGHKSLWGQNKYPVQAMLMAMTYLSHVLIFNFLEYAPTPPKIWKELNFIYQFTENMNQHRAQVKLVGSSKKNNISTIELTFKRIIMISLADPYHLPFGAIWEIFEQLAGWADHVDIKPFRKVDDPNGIFVINIDRDTSPLPYSKFNVAIATENHRLVDTGKLQKIIKQHLDKLESKGKPDADLVFSEYYADYMLRIINKAWGLPPKRYHQRTAKSGQLNIAHGLNSIYFHLNREQDFKQMSDDQQQDEIIAGADNTVSTITNRYRKETWSLVDASSGGFAVTRDDKPGNAIQVGDLIGLSLDEKNMPHETFRIGILRWLLVRQNKVYKAGIQVLNQQIYAGGVRAREGNQIEREYRRAVLTGNPVKQSELCIITHKGLYLPNRDLEIIYKDKKYSAQIIDMEESTSCFDHFNIKLQ